MQTPTSGSKPMPVKPHKPEMESGRADTLRKVRASKRSSHRLAASAARAAGTSLLEVSTVKPETAMTYDDQIKRFVNWVGKPVQEMIGKSILDVSMVEFFEAMYFEGHNHHIGDSLLSALEYRDRRIKKGGKLCPLRAREALRGFRRLAPGLSRAPLPEIALHALVGAAISLGQLDFGLALLVQFCGYLRPAELLNLKGRQIILAVQGSGVKHIALLLHPQEDGATSKTEERDESILLDWPIFSETRAAFAVLKKRDASPAFGLDYRKYSELFHICAEMSGVVTLKCHPYSIRHGGASRDALLRTRTLAQIKARGRWRADASVRRYEKHARVLREVERLPAATRRYGAEVAPLLGRMLLRRMAARKPPFAKGTLPRGAKRRATLSGPAASQQQK